MDDWQQAVRRCLCLEIEVEARDCSEKDLLGHANKTSHGPDLAGLGIPRDCAGTDALYLSFDATGLLDLVIVYLHTLH